MVEIRRLKPSVAIRMPTKAVPPAPRQFKVVTRRLADYPAPTPQPTPCRLWQGATDKDGYGYRRVDRDGKRFKQGIHRWVMEQVMGRRLFPDEFILHACDNPPCYRIDHLSVGTAADNNHDMMAKGRYVHVAPHLVGEQHGRSKLSDQQVIDIRRARKRGLMAPTLAKEYGVSVATIHRIVRGQSWTHLPLDPDPPRDLIAEAKARLAAKEKE